MKRVFFIAFFAMISLSACGPAATVQPTADPKLTAEALVGTIVAQTMQAIPTNTSIPPTDTPTPVLPTETSMPVPPSETATAQATATATGSGPTATPLQYGPNFVRLRLFNYSTKGCYWIQFAGAETYSTSVCSSSELYLRKGSYAYVIYFGLERTFEGGISIVHKDPHTLEVYDDKVKFIKP
jgi:hypothetical protein